MTNSRHDASARRREFLLRACALGATGAGAPLALNLAALGAAAAQSAPAATYKALVCVFLYGGNDPYNSLVPYDAAAYKAYAQARSDIALPRDALQATALRGKAPAPGGAQFALAPSLAPLKPLYESGDMAVLLNIGPLVAPTSKQEYIGARVPLPPKLFSHNDQQSYWQALAPEGAASGWAGRLTDLYANANAQRTFTGITAGGSSVLLAGRKVAGYRVGIHGSTQIELLTRDMYGSSACTALLRQLITQPREHLMEREMSRIAAQSIDADTRLRAALADVAVPGDFSSPLAQQLKIVARIIAARQALGARRQVFFVSQNGYDNHAGLNDTHPALLKELGQALATFQQALSKLGVADQVTTFTASEFGRTLGSNGNGSDHGWGSHHFVLGGAVQGGRYYGSHPEIALNGPGFVDNGRLLPTLAVDQLGAALGGWFGASRDDLGVVFPNLRRFDAQALDLLLRA
ncbi:DUF1501 domain-containing protein [Achromobacter insolitus]|uniref:Tat pathway signal protein n=3 Tax=Achromobacter insolitus TaxID=217204 RepID=A0A6S7F8S6_9BURK|nr:DUF1501 domain-containing protein [Achromobacter insolitus]GLK96229.1 Tat pathway signal protein [Achromobacter xylosoxidans]APX76001.1 Tat pathway signal protein [Achromobacter insolitus]AXA71597.1 Tat pathway signal protein [Achromobacter insolitus]MDH3062976.1 DUF1501 domain-containing protein [Achromobacter insolitus]OWT54076.1 Tat pathway signal protein [Achromobacter insolitus]